MKDLNMKTLQKEGFGIWERQDKGDKGGYIENPTGYYALMLFPKDLDVFNKYKDRDIYTINNRQMSRKEVAKVDIEDEDTRFGLVSFGIITKFIKSDKKVAVSRPYNQGE